MWTRVCRAGLVVFALILMALLGGCQLLEPAAPAAPGPSNPPPTSQVPADESPRIRSVEDIPPTWTPPAAIRSETPIAPETVATIQSGGQAQYTVQSGDTLAEIAIRFNITLEALAAANGIEDYDYIEAGQVLVIPR